MKFRAGLIKSRAAVRFQTAGEMSPDLLPDAKSRLFYAAFVDHPKSILFGLNIEIFLCLKKYSHNGTDRGNSTYKLRYRQGESMRRSSLGLLKRFV